MRVKRPRCPAQQRSQAKPRAQVLRQVGGCDVALAHSRYQKRVTARWAKILGNERHLTYVSSLNDQHIAIPERNTWPCAMPLSRNKERTTCEIDFSILHMKRLKVSHSTFL